MLHRGSLVLVDHNIAAEAAVMALGGAPPPCFDVYRSWRARQAWESALQPRGPGFHQLYRRPPLPRELLMALESGVARAWERRAGRGDDNARDALDRAIRGRAEPALASALAAARRRCRGGPVTRFELRVGAAPEVSGRLTEKETSLSVRLTPDWYRTVGQQRLALRGDVFVATLLPEPLLLQWHETSPGRWSPSLDREATRG